MYAGYFFLTPEIKLWVAVLRQCVDDLRQGQHIFSARFFIEKSPFFEDLAYHAGVEPGILRKQIFAYLPAIKKHTVKATPTHREEVANRLPRTRERAAS